MRAHLYTVVYRYIRPLPPPSLPPPVYRGVTEGPGPPFYVGSSEERPCPDLGLCAPPSTPAGAGAAVEGWAPPPPDDCTCRVKPRLKSPPLLEGGGGGGGLPPARVPHHRSGGGAKVNAVWIRRVLTSATRRQWRNRNGGVKTAAWRTFRRRSTLHRAVKNKRVTVRAP